MRQQNLWRLNAKCSAMAKAMVKCADFKFGMHASNANAQRDL